MDFNLNTFLFFVLATLSGMCAVAVVVTQNIVRAAAWLLFTLAGVSGIFFLLGFDFVGATQLLVYVGGTLVLVVFGVMLTAQGPFIKMKAGAGEWALATVVGLLLFAVLTVSTWTAAGAIYRPPPAEESPGTSTNTSRIGISFMLPVRNEPVPPAKATEISYLLPFEIVSVHLLVVLIGAAYLARAKRRRGAPS
jgi:NADH:ubiquinone oxidoreductase subunit 6 (subunit J)